MLSSSTHAVMKGRSYFFFLLCSIPVFRSRFSSSIQFAPGFRCTHFLIVIVLKVWHQFSSRLHCGGHCTERRARALKNTWTHTQDYTFIFICSSKNALAIEKQVVSATTLFPEFRSITHSCPEQGSSVHTVRCGPAPVPGGVSATVPSALTLLRGRPEWAIKGDLCIRDPMSRKVTETYNLWFHIFLLEYISSNLNFFITF